jgi:uncharacterized protein (DUF1684 family)
MGVRRAVLRILLPAVLVLAGCQEQEGVSMRSGSELSPETFESVNMDWRKRRVARLTEPHGWLSLAGLIMLQADSVTTVGSDSTNDVVVSSGPARWGSIQVDEDGRVRFDVAVPGGVRIDGEAVTSAEMTLAGDGEPVQVEADDVRIHLVAPGGKLALRIRDPQSSTRTEFVGLDYYPLDPDWRVEAEFIPHPSGSTMQVANVMGQLIEEPNPGMVRFVHEGKTISLEAVLEDDQLFFIFADRTSGRETYGLGRFLYAELPRDGRVVLDFNQAYNPPCAFNAYTTCPLPPQSNRVDVWMRAGEKQYAGKPGLEKPGTMPSGARLSGF